MFFVSTEFIFTFTIMLCKDDAPKVIFKATKKGAKFNAISDHKKKHKKISKCYQIE